MLQATFIFSLLLLSSAQAHVLPKMDLAEVINLATSYLSQLLTLLNYFLHTWYLLILLPNYDLVIGIIL